MNKNIELMLKKVNKPGRYVGGEYGAVARKENYKVHFALAFPDVYEVGMSHLGSQLLYSEINSRSDSFCERVYSPWPDFEKELRKNNCYLFSLETGTSLREFDVIGITLQYELTYTNILNLLDLSGLPLYSRERDETFPLVIGGGPCVYNPAPVADFFDCFLIGEGDEAIHEICAAVAAWKDSGKAGGRLSLLKLLAEIDGIYVPVLGGRTVKKRICKNIDFTAQNLNPIVPNIEIIHDRAMLELFRGCTRGCRFCQAGFVYRPVRERNPLQVPKQADRLLRCTGYNEIALTSLSSADYSGISECITEIQSNNIDNRISVSLPSLRIDSVSVDLARQVQNVRHGSMTFAPEAGTQRMRDIINKNVTEADIDAAFEAAFAAGCKTVKLYFMIGLPFETDADVLGIIDTAVHIEQIFRRITGRGGVKVTVSVSNFVPKSFTPFQFQPQNSRDEFARKHVLLRSAAQGKRWLSLKYHDAGTSCLEGAIARGGTELSEVVEAAWRSGARFDGWSEYFNLNLWQEAFWAKGLDLDEYSQNIHKQVVPAWNMISAGVSDEYFSAELKESMIGALTPDCRRTECTGCGVCDMLDATVIDYKEVGNDVQTDL